MRINTYMPSKKAGNTIGFLNIEIDTDINGMKIPEAIEVIIMRNSHNGHLFVSWPSRQYTAPDGTTRYAPLVKWPKEKYDIVQNEVIKHFQDYIAKNRPSVQADPYPPTSMSDTVDSLPF